MIQRDRSWDHSSPVNTHNMNAIEVRRLWVVSYFCFVCGFEISWDFVPCWHFWPRLPELSRLDHDFQSKRLPSISQRSGICSVPFRVSSLPHVGSLVCWLFSENISSDADSPRWGAFCFWKHAEQRNDGVQQLQQRIKRRGTPRRGWDLKQWNLVDC